ncbi:barstar family protein [Streptomyces sp. NPDC096097]|uniref:barstar family protein n=1 Tax=Streptomyces sp. NPDC096097 TaxID=3155546 RepID=UPI00331EA647
MKYLLVQADEDGVEQLWGRCAGVEGLFADPVPLPREVLTLRGCRPEGLLNDVLAAPDVSLRGLGDVCVEVMDDERSVQWWTLVDAVVVAHRPDPADPARYDIVLGAAVRKEESFVDVPAPQHFELLTATGPAGRCSAVEGLFAPRADPEPVPMELIGCEAAEPVLVGTQQPRRWARDQLDLLVLDRQGAVMASRTVGMAIGGASPSALGEGLEDITLIDGGADRPSPAVRPVWARWYQGPPTEPNLWAPYDAQGREEWLELTTRAWREPAPRPDRSGGEYRLDGRFVTDVPGLHCAMAEALVGPGRYFGREWHAFADCLAGGFAVVPPFTLIWQDSEVARRAPADPASQPQGLSAYFEDVVRLLERRGVTVVLR